MQALVLGRPGVERTRLSDLLLGAGFTVDQCHHRNWGCVGMDGDCPLDVAAVDVAVAVTDPSDRFDAQGIACVYRARIPIVTVGATANDPVLDYATASVAHIEASLVDIVRTAASDASGHRDAVEQSLTPRLLAGEQLSVSARRTGGRIDVTLTGNVTGQRAAALAEAARAAIRAHDPRSATIDVSVVPAIAAEHRPD